eukprot:SM000044S15970  [mRNA]  locus=s44:293303:296569:+ [translate_table: standard]
MIEQVDEKGWNPVWDAMDYAGPPEFTEALQDPLPKPLDSGLLDLSRVKGDLSKALVVLGCHVAAPAAPAEVPGWKLHICEPTIQLDCDAVVVGSGSGGGVIAAQLAKAGHQVLVLEKGRYYAGEDLTQLEGPTLAAMYERGGFLSSEDGSLALLAGSTVGGGTAINWAASFRTPAHVVREWSQELGLSHFGDVGYQQAMDAVCERLGVHAADTVHSFQNEVLRRGCAEMGYPVDDIPRNAAGAHSCGACGFGCRSGSKQATSETWLKDAVGAGALVLAGCRAERVILEQSKACGGRKATVARGVLAFVQQEAVAESRRRLFIRARIVVVAAGSLQTPALLLRSGLRNTSIGRTLHVHPVTAVWGYFPLPTVARTDAARTIPGRSYDGGIMTAYSPVAADWAGCGYGPLLQTPAVHPASFAALAQWRSGPQAKSHMLKYSRVANVIVLLRDRGSGSVTLDGKGDPSVSYTLSKHDAANMQQGVACGLRLLVAAGAREVSTYHAGLEPLRLPPDGGKEERLRLLDEYLGQVRALGLRKNHVPLFSAHQLGSCRMGVSPKDSVVDSNGESWEAAGLFLGDGSVLPTASGVNPMITIQSVAYVTGQNIVHLMTKGLV